MVVAWKGSVLLWEATKQSFTTLLMAESELVGMTHAAQVGECVAPVIEELVEDDIVISLLGDNAAAPTARAAWGFLEIPSFKDEGECGKGMHSGRGFASQFHSRASSSQT